MKHGALKGYLTFDRTKDEMKKYKKIYTLEFSELNSIYNPKEKLRQILKKGFQRD